jgi:hypothetical protein
MSAANDEAILLNKGSIGIPLFNGIAASQAVPPAPRNDTETKRLVMTTYL